MNGFCTHFLVMCKWVSWVSAVLFTTFTVYKLHFIICKVVNMPRNQINRLCHRHRQQILLLLMLIEVNLMVREIWVHPLNDLRPEKGEFYSLYPDLRHFSRWFFHMYWMSVHKFDELLEILEPHLKKSSWALGHVYSPEQRLVLTLRQDISY